MHAMINPYLVFLTCSVCLLMMGSIAGLYPMSLLGKTIYRPSPREELGTYLGVTTPAQEQSTRDTTCDSPKEVNIGRPPPPQPRPRPRPPQPLPYRELKQTSETTEL